MRRVDLPGENPLADELQAIWDAIRSIRMGTQGIITDGSSGSAVASHVFYQQTDPGPQSFAYVWYHTNGDGAVIETKVYIP